MTLRRGTPFVCLAISLCSAQARADEATDIQSLLDERVIVTAASNAQRESAAPALSTTITAQDIETFGFRSIAEAVDFLSLGVFSGDGLLTPDLGSRGILFANDNGKHVLLLINGHAVNDPLYGAARFDMGAGIPMELVDRIEVVLGPGSVLYGSNAMMGVINVITKDAADYSGVHAYGDTQIGRSFRVGAGTGYAFELLGLPSQLTLGVEYDERYGPELEFPVQRFPDTNGALMLPRQWGGRLDKGYFARAPAGHLKLQVGDLEVNLWASMYERGIPYASDAFNVNFNDGKSSENDRTVRIDVRYQATITALVQLTSRAYADGFDYLRRLNGDGFFGCLNLAIKECQLRDVGVARWFGLEERLTFNWLHDQTLVTSLGVDVRERQVGAKQDKFDASNGQPIAATGGRLDDHGASFGPYIQQTWNPAAWIDLNAGARLDIDRRFSSVLSPRGAVALRPFDRTTFKAIYSQAFRAPTWSETSLANHSVVPSQGLLPERVRSIEASAEQGIGTQRLLLGAFATDWSDVVETAPISPAELARLEASGVITTGISNAVQSTNVASINNYGVSGNWQGSSLEGKLRYGANLTWARARMRKAGASERLPAAPAIVGNAHIAYRFGGYLPTAALAVQAMSTRPANRTAPSGATLDPAPAIANFHLALTGRAPLVPGLGYTVTADYLTSNRSPYMAGPDFTTGSLTEDVRAGLPEPGYAPIDQLRIMIGLRLDFPSDGGPTDTAEAP